MSFPTPVAQSNTIVVPGRNTPIRYTEALGRVSFEPRSFQMIFTMHGSRDKYNVMVSEASNMFNGVLSEVITSEEPTLYMVGTLKVAPSYDPMTKKGTVEISCEDGDSYRYYVEETIQLQVQFNIKNHQQLPGHQQELLFLREQQLYLVEEQFLQKHLTTSNIHLPMPLVRYPFRTLFLQHR